MCGITGIWAFNEKGRSHLKNLTDSTQSMTHRGPDDHGIYQDDFVGLGHKRLSIIDTSPAGHQPMSTSDNRYTIVFNGEIYNYQALRKTLESQGVTFRSDSDTEVLLQLLIHEGKKAIQKLNGFFVFAFYDQQANTLLIARDRLGIKPLLYFQDEDKFLFASEMQAVLAYALDRKIDQTALGYYLQLNYTPAPFTMMEGVKKLLPGHLIEIQNGQAQITAYYEIPKRDLASKIMSYEDAKKELRVKLDESVKKRMIADVPLGCFLSGGIDSSVITAIASQYTDQLSTFSIGFSDNKFFDETHYAESVASKFRTQHTTFKLSNEEIFSHLHDMVDHLDEPFADSSAIPVYVLSKKTREHVTVALSGDGADEIFSGYNKHEAWWKMEHDGIFKNMVKAMQPIASILPKSRSGKWSNYMRQILRFAKAAQLDRTDRYWFLASISSESDIKNLLNSNWIDDGSKNQWMKPLEDYQDISDFLRTDTDFLLPNDMLKKVDLMSMANSLEVRVPFLDHEVVDYVFSLPENFKIDGKMRKKILQDTFRELLPPELYQRPKKGFEMPLLDWLKNSLGQELDQEVFNRDKVDEQQIFNWKHLEQMKKKLHSKNPEDSHAQVWAIYAFQKWYNRYF